MVFLSERIIAILNTNFFYWLYYIDRIWLYFSAGGAYDTSCPFYGTLFWGPYHLCCVCVKWFYRVTWEAKINSSIYLKLLIFPPALALSPVHPDFFSGHSTLWGCWEWLTGVSPPGHFWSRPHGLPNFPALPWSGSRNPGNLCSPDTLVCQAGKLVQLTGGQIRPLYIIIFWNWLKIVKSDSYWSFFLVTWNLSFN